MGAVSEGSRRVLLVLLSTLAWAGGAGRAGLGATTAFSPSPAALVPRRCAVADTALRRQPGLPGGRVGGCDPRTRALSVLVILSMNRENPSAGSQAGGDGETRENRAATDGIADAGEEESLKLCSKPVRGEVSPRARAGAAKGPGAKGGRRVSKVSQMLVSPSMDFGRAMGGEGFVKKIDFLGVLMPQQKESGQKGHGGGREQAGDRAKRGGGVLGVLSGSATKVREVEKFLPEEEDEEDLQEDVAAEASAFSSAPWGFLPPKRPPPPAPTAGGGSALGGDFFLNSMSSMLKPKFSLPLASAKSPRIPRSNPKPHTLSP